MKTPEETTPASSAMRVLVVEDEESMRLLLTYIISNRGHEVVAVATAEEALKKHEAQPFSIMILDWMLPGMDGLEFCRRVRAMPGGESIVIIVTTGRSRPEDIWAVCEAGASDYVAKPIDVDNLQARLEIAERRAVDNQRGHRAEIALARSQSMLSAALNNDFQGFIFVDQGGRIQAFNKVADDSAAVLYGRPLEVGAAFAGYVDAKAPGEYERLSGKLQAGDIIVEELQTQKREGGESRWFEFNGIPVLDGKRELTGVCFSIVDITERKRHEEEVKTSQANLSALLENTDDAIWSIDAGYRLVTFNTVFDKQFAQAFGGRPMLGNQTLGSQTLGTSAFTLLDPKETEQWKALFDRALAGERFSWEYERTLAGRQHYYLLSFNPIIRDGQVSGVSVFSREITDRVAAQSALRESEQSLKNIIDSLAEGVIATDELGLVRRMNAVAEQLTGWRTADAMGKAANEIFRLVDDATEVPLTFPIESVLKSSSAVHLGKNFTLLTPEGRRPVSASLAPQKNAAGGIVGALIVFRDVSQERAADAALKNSQLKFRQLIEGMPDGVALRRGDHFVYVNPSWAAMLGYEPSELVGRRMLDFIHADDTAAAVEHIKMLDQDAKAPTAFEFRMLHRSGETVTVELAPVTHIDFEGKQAALIVARDITERKKMQARLMVADRMASVGTLAAGVAHEINNPLAYVIANLGFINEAFPKLAPLLPSGSLQEVSEALKEARDGAERVRQIVRDLKTFSRGENSEQERSVADVRRVLESSINMAWNEIRHRSRLVKLISDVPLVEANEARLGQVFLNLLVNAAQAIPEGAAEQNEIRVSAYCASSGKVVVEVKDTGGGIPQEYLSRIFDPFFTTKPVGVGTGLGLSICHNIVVALGGEIQVDSQRGQGTTIRVLLPASGQAAAVEPQKSAAAEKEKPIEKRARILIVDDEVLVINALRRALRDHEVISANSGREALEKMRDPKGYDVVFCDLMMPDLTGMDVYEQIHSERPGLEERVVFMTGGAFTPRAWEFLSHVPNHRIEKPFDPQSIRALVRDRTRNDS